MQNEIRTDSGSFSLSIKLCRFSRITNWGNQTLFSPFWRCYVPLTKGASFISENKEYKLTPGTAILIAPYTNLITSAKKAFFKSYAHFTIDDQYLPCRNHIQCYDIRKETRDLLEFCSRIHNRERHHFIMMQLITTGLAGLPGNHFTRFTGEPRILKTVNYMREHIGKPMSNSFLAQKAGLHPNSFIRSFTEQMKDSPQNYYMRLRLELACQLLTCTWQSIEEIAEQCGFCDRSHFSKAFTNMWSCPPAEFRNRNR